MNCAVEGCAKKKMHRGYCLAHYERLLSHGDPLAGRTAVGAPQAWLSEFLATPPDTDECTPWPFCTEVSGYGSVRIAGSMQKVHRYVCKYTYGEPPSADLHAAHSCGNGHLGCINPRHLRWATRKENMEDALLAGVMAKALTAEDVKSIREKHQAGDSQMKLSREYGVRPYSISKIVHRRSWKHVA